MMDVVFFTTSLERGGAETQLVRVAIQLKQRGWKVGILTMLPSTQFLEEVAAAGIPLVACSERPGGLPIGMAFRVMRQLRAWRPALLVTFNFPADAMGRVCGRLAGVRRVIATIRTAFVKTPLRKQFYRFTEPLVALTVSNSNAAIDYMVSQGLLTRERTAVISNGMIFSEAPSAEATRQLREELGYSREAFVWMAVGNLRPAKDYPNLLAAAARCAAASEHFRLCIVGGGEDSERIQALAKELGLDRVVTFLGSRPDVPRLLSIPDAFVLSSAWEGMPNTVMEAMAAGVPVVTTDVGGVRELIQHGHSGFIVPPRDSEALAAQMLALMAAGFEDRRRVAEAGRSWVLDRFELGRVVDQWEALLRERSLRPLGPASPAP